MFGYIKAYKPDMRVCEYETYKAVYCTLCKRLGKEYGPFARLTLSYDFTFLAILQLAMSDSCPGYEKKRCAFNPLKKCSYCKAGDGDFEFACAAAMIMLYYKISDNINDSGFFKSICFRMARLIFKHPYKKASKKYPALAKIVATMMERQSLVEREKCTGIDAASEPTATALSEIFELCSEDEGQKRILKRFGYCIGKWVYLMDAVDDLEDDVKTGNYNLIALLCKENGPECENIKPAIKLAEANLNVCVAQAGLALELLKLNRYQEILQNIIYLGLPNVQKETMKKVRSE